MLLLLSICLYILIRIYHGFQVFGSDTIETVPYALWLADKSLFAKDFHIQLLSSIFPNERWSVSWILHFFPRGIAVASQIFHAIFSMTLLAGMIRFSDLILKHIEFAVIAVFITLFSLYHINIGGNELYYNMFVPSLAGKAFGIWALVFVYKEKYILASIALILASLFHPLVGFQLFVILVLMEMSNMVLSKKVNRNVLFPVLLYVFTAGVWIYFIARNTGMGSGPKMEDSIEFFDIIAFRIAHHFLPWYFPRPFLLFFTALYFFSILHYVKSNRFLYAFFIWSLCGILIYTVGVYLEIEFVLSSQWMKMNIWLKFFGVIALFSWIQKIVDKKYFRIVALSSFIVFLAIAIKRFQPVYDADYPSDLYTWISINSDKDALFLVPPELTDFKARTLRSSYFDFKAMIHHKPDIFEWAERFGEVYGLDIKSRPTDQSIFSYVSDHYFDINHLDALKDIDYFIVRKAQLNDTLIDIMEKHKRNHIYSDTTYVIFGTE